MNQTTLLATLSRVAANPAIDQPHLGEIANIAATDFVIDPGNIHIHLAHDNPRPLLNNLIAWAYLLDQPQVTLIDYGMPSGVHIHVDGHLDGDHIAAWSGVTGTAAAILREPLNGQKRAVVPLHVLRSAAVRLSDGAANLARVPTTDPGLRTAADALTTREHRQWENAAGERWMDHPSEPDTLVLLATSSGPTHHVHTQPRAAVEAHGGPLTEVDTREENDRG